MVRPTAKMLAPSQTVFASRRSGPVNRFTAAIRQAFAHFYVRWRRVEGGRWRRWPWLWRMCESVGVACCVTWCPSFSVRHRVRVLLIRRVTRKQNVYASNGKIWQAVVTLLSISVLFPFSLIRLSLPLKYSLLGEKLVKICKYIKQPNNIK